MSGLKRAARDYIWLLDLRSGLTIAEIATWARTSTEEVEEGIARAIGSEPGPVPLPAAPHVIPLFPVGGLTPKSSCPHAGPLPLGSGLYCVVCDGIDPSLLAGSPSPAPAARTASRPRSEASRLRGGAA